ncbi:MAG TPA: VOC family protein [Acidimicrobiales bacterium]|jgi:catechol 2,3-dioxygenase-like lactoylglutathione lyase family enzyme
MSAWLNNLDVVTLFVEDVARTKAFYQEVFGLSAIFENENSIVFNLDNTSLNFLQRDSAPGLVAPATVAPPDTGHSFQFTIRVDSVDEACAELARRGVSLNNGPMDRPWGVRTASFSDPDGCLWEIAE